MKIKGKNKEKIPEEVTLDNYNSLNDCLFYKYMCEEGNELQQKIFLESLGIEVKGKLNILNERIAPELINRKTCILDFLAETDDTLINIELQQEFTDDFIQRIIYYMGKLIRLYKGNQYNLFRDVIVISIINIKWMI